MAGQSLQSKRPRHYAARSISLSRADTAKNADRAYNLNNDTIAKQGEIVVSMSAGLPSGDTGQPKTKYPYPVNTKVKEQYIETRPLRQSR